MNRRQQGLVIIAIIIVVVIVAGVFLTSTNPGGNKRLKVVASFYPLGFFAGEIGKEYADVSLLIPENAEPHSWEPKPSDMISVEDADVFVYNGAGLEPWVEDILSAIHNEKLAVIETSRGVNILFSEEIDRMMNDSERWFQTGPFVNINASSAAGSAPSVTPANQCVNITLTPGKYVSLSVGDTGDYVLFLSQDINASVMDPSGNILKPEGSISNPAGHTEIRRVETYEFTRARYTLQFPPGIEQIKMSILRLEGEVHGLNDPHFWVDPLSAKVQVENILSGFLNADPEHSEAYRKNADALQSRLDHLHQMFLTGLKNRTKNDIVTTHAAFSYIAHRYGFRQHAALGISPDEQPSAQALADLAEMVRTLGLHYVYVEPIYSDEYMQTIARETGAGVLILDGLHGRAGPHADMDYFEIMQENLHNLEIGMEVK